MIKQAKHISGFAELDNSVPCYYKGPDGTWYLYLPGCGLGNLANHQVEEHEDGTISVTTSILVTGHDSGQPTQVHGYLTRGEWRDC
jgi:hypothetical protein